MAATAIPAKVGAAFAAGMTPDSKLRPSALRQQGPQRRAHAARVCLGLASLSLAALLVMAAPAAHAEDGGPTANTSQSVASPSLATPSGAGDRKPEAPATATPATSPTTSPAGGASASPAHPSPEAAGAREGAGATSPAGRGPLPAAAQDAPGSVAPGSATPNPAAPGAAGTAPAAVKAEISPTVILVHSELLDGSAWRGVIPLLQRAGVNALAVQLPLNSMWADVAVVQRALAIVKGPVILVGHSWGGVIITEAGVDRKVAALVYVAAMAPDVGQSFIDRLRNAPRGPGLAKLLTDSSGFVRLADDAFATDFGQDLDAAQNRLLAATQAPVFGKVFEERVNNAAWKNLPVWYVVASNDRLLDPGAQQTEAGRIKARTVSTPASHAVVLSQPDVVARAILDAVSAVKAGASAGHDGAAQQLQPLSPPVQPETPKK